MQLEKKVDNPGRGRGRGRGRGKNPGRGKKTVDKGPSSSWKKNDMNGDDDWETWMDEDYDYDYWNDADQWYGTESGGWDEEPAPTRPSKKPKTNNNKEAAAKPKASKARKASPKAAPEPSASSAKAEPAKRKRAPKREDSEAAPKERKTTRKTKVSEELKKLDPAPATEKEQKNEIMQALWFAKDLTEDNAKEELHRTVPNFKKLGYDSVLNIYWVRRGVRGVGVGVKSVSEGKDFAFFGFKAECECWIYAMAAALKAAEIMASLLKLNSY